MLNSFRGLLATETASQNGSKPMRRCLTSLALAVATVVPSSAEAWHRLPPGIDGWQRAGLPAMRGITVGPIESSQQIGRGYGTPYSEALLDELAKMNVTWISITPFGRIWSLDSTDILMDFEAPYALNRTAVRTMVQQAHARGMAVLVIPHLWVEMGGWRGEIDPGSDIGWAKYRESYRRFVLAWAEDAALAGADAFSIGVECKSWSGRFGGWWTTFIAEVRSSFAGLLTYSANWDEADAVLFWDQLDLIGINAFFPLADHDGATDSEYGDGARRAAQAIHDTASVLDMPVVFVEVGYTSRPNAAVQPWLWPDDMTHVIVDEREQARAVNAMLGAVASESWFAGAFLWRYYANIDDVSQEAAWGFSPHGKLAERTIAAIYSVPWAVDPSPWPWEN